jgi:RNA polymerase sigma factor (sigma-70 family)
MKGPDTSMGGAGRDFPPTPGFLKAGPGTGEAPWADALDQLSRIYWKPVYLFLRTVGGLSNDDAKDLAQQFFLRLVESRSLDRYEPSRAPFRVYLKACLKNFLTDEFRIRAAKKRSIDRTTSASDDVAVAPEAEKEFDRAWLQSVLEAAVDLLKEDLLSRGRSAEWALFQAYDLRDPGAPKTTYEELGREHRMSEGEVRGALAFVRGKLRERVIEQVRKSVNGTEELHSELRHLGFV